MTMFIYRILHDMPVFLRDEAVGEAYGGLVKDVSLLSRLPPSMLSVLVMRLTPQRVMPTQLVTRQDEVGSDMYIVTHGLLREIVGRYEHAPFLLDSVSAAKRPLANLPGVYPAHLGRLKAAGNFVDDAGHVSTLLGRGDYFAENCIMTSTQRRHRSNVVSVQVSNLLALSKSAFTEACELFPELYTLMFEELKDDSAQFLQLASFNAAKEGSAFL